MQKAEKRMCVILKKIKTSKISHEDICKSSILNDLWKASKDVDSASGIIRRSLVCLCLLVFAAAYTSLNQNSECILEMPVDVSKVFRKPEECSLCENSTKIYKVGNISTQDFENMYMITAQPVVITDGTKGWSAVEHFQFSFFKQLYQNVSSEENKISCQFFPYKTEFKTLKHALNMSNARSRLEEGEKPWYIGWSNCNDEAGKILRQYYDRPYFLPETSENMALNWIFMGGPGHGAHMHVDDVQLPSWQAQLKGKKQWILAPPPECLYRCSVLDIVVEPAEIIVVDTNRWYHQTYVLPGEISITIGSEFD